jgi:NitT/TauT family transport system permease protein
LKLLGGVDEGSPLLKLILALSGILFVLAIWIFLTQGTSPVITPGILPSPFRVLTSFGDLINDNELLRNAGLSIGLNLAGYLEAICIAVPLGFLIGLIKWTRWGFQRQVDAIRYVPLTAVTGLFIVWFGIGASMKIHFLAFGILIYLLPVIVQRIDEVDDVYLKTVHTLGATDWQVLRTVYFPSVLSRLSDDIRVLTAISWTYIIVAEGIGSQGGIGDLIWKAGLRQGRVDKVFALLIIIMIIGVIQDKIFVWLDRELFPHKYQAKDAVKAAKLRQKNLVSVIFDYALVVLGWIVLAIYIILMINEFAPFLALKPLSYLFGSTAWVIHLIVILFLIFRGWRWMQNRTDAMALQSIKQ